MMLKSWERTVELAYVNHHVITEVNKKQQVNWLLVDLGLENIIYEVVFNRMKEN